MNYKVWIVCGGLSAAALAAGCQPGDEPGPPRLAPERTASGAVIAPDTGLNPSAKPMPPKAPAESLDAEQGVQNPLPNATTAPSTQESGGRQVAPMRPGAGTGSVR